jgi:hypothetical protein
MMKNIRETNKHGILISDLQKCRVATKDYNKVYAIKYENNLMIAQYSYVHPKYNYKQTIRPFTKNKTYMTSSAPREFKISSVYKQDIYRTKDIDKYISTYRKEDKTLES